MFRDTLLSRPGRKCLILPFEPARTVQKVSETGSKSGQYTAFFSFIEAENVFSVTFPHPFVTLGGPTHWFWCGKCSHFSWKSDETGLFGSLIKPTYSCQKLKKVTFCHLFVTF